ncbi:MAG: hypothetical protein P4L99_21750 [Chthoniobacter sp.]|nr:hypothetical protein [Chthoniobacter sp.]
MKLAIALFSIVTATALFGLFGKPDADENHPAGHRRRGTDFTHEGDE